MYEHKKLMKEKIEYAASLGYLPKNQSYSECYGDMANDFFAVCNLCIKHRVTKNVKKEKIEDIIEKTAANEKALIKEILNSI